MKLIIKILAEIIQLINDRFDEDPTIYKYSDIIYAKITSVFHKCCLRSPHVYQSSMLVFNDLFFFLQNSENYIFSCCDFISKMCGVYLKYNLPKYRVL